MGDFSDTLRKFTRWLGFITSLLTTVLGIVHLCSIKARISWPGSFKDDFPNKQSWRISMFTFAPETFLDVWTPVVFGLYGMVIHFRSFHSWAAVTKNFMLFFAFHFVSGLFAVIGYEGGLGIIFSCFSWLTCLCSLFLGMTTEDHANLDLELFVYAR